MSASNTLEARLEEFFRPGGVLARAHPGWEPRPSQLALARDVLRTLSSEGHLVAEAGTGVGKTLAYLVPAVLLGRRVVVSTGTRTLQDQLARKDVPFLQQACRLPFRACTLKGRDNYLCRHRFESFEQAPSFADRAEAAAWPSVASWARQTVTGDVAELSHVRENPAFWPLVNASNATCLGQRCPRHADCHLHELRRQAHEAELVIVNHHLFLADTAVRRGGFGGILPDAELVIFDEAHGLEDAATSFFGRSVSSRRLRDLGDDAVRELARAGVDAPGVSRRAADLAEVAGAFASPWGAHEGRRVLPAQLSTLQQDALESAAGAVKRLAEAIAAVPGMPAAVEPFARRAEDLVEDLELLRRRDDSSWVYWTEIRGRSAFVSATPVDVSTLLREQVFATRRATVLCSATLAVGGSMAHVRSRLGLEDRRDGLTMLVRDAVHASPFDHESQGLLFLPRGLPEPKDRGFAAACAATIRELLRASSGRAFLLFTSFENLNRVRMILEGLPWPVLVQGDAPKAELLRRFQERRGSVLFATSSFWEGVDVPGPALSLVVIDKLPFAVPSDPIVAARARLVEDAGGNAFRDLSLPEAVLALKQGVGRLIRSRSDRGVVAILDPRLSTTRYGAAFLEDLPPLRRTSDVEDVHAFFEQDRL